MFTLDVCVCVNVTVKLNIATMETQTQTHRMGLNPFLTFYIDAMLNVDANGNVPVNCEHTIKTIKLFDELIHQRFRVVPRIFWDGNPCSPLRGASA